MPPHDMGRLAQLGEHLPYKEGVTGSRPVSPTTLFSNYLNNFLFPFNLLRLRDKVRRHCHVSF